MAGKFRPKPHDFADYVQAGNLGLLAAINKCESSRKLSSYARTAIYRAIRDYKNKTEGPVYRPVGLRRLVQIPLGLAGCPRDASGV